MSSTDRSVHVGGGVDGTTIHTGDTIINIQGTQSKNKDSIKESIKAYSNRINNTICNQIAQVTLDPPDLCDVLDFVDSNDRCWIIGKRGIGKSAMLRRIFDKLVSEGKTAIILTSNEILSKQGLDSLSKKEIGESLIEVAKQIASDEDFFVLIDSVDSIMRNPTVGSFLTAEIDAIQAIKGVHTVLTIRESDLETFPDIFPERWGKRITLKGFSTEQVKRMLETIGMKDKLSDTLFSILRIPFFLGLLATIVQKGSVSNLHLSNEYNFLQTHYDRVIRNSAQESHLFSAKQAILDHLVDSMVKNRSFKVSKNSVPSNDAFHSLRRDGVILEDTFSLEFFHHMYFDFLVAIRIADGTSILNFLENFQNEPFLKSSFDMALTYIRGRNAWEFRQTLQTIFGAPEDYVYWKLATLEFIASADEIEEGEKEEMQHVLSNDSILQRHFLLMIIEMKKVNWYTYWADTVFDDWAKDGSFEHKDLLSRYIAIAVGGLSGE